MGLVSIEYEEFTGEPREWVLECAQFNTINLIVGKNSTGKTRVLNVIKAFAVILSGKGGRLYQSGFYKVHFDFSGEAYFYSLHIKAHKVVSEVLEIDGRTLLSRDQSGAGSIYAEEMGKNMNFKIPETDLAVCRRDSIQHPFLESLYQWGTSLRIYLFGSEFGKNLLSAVADKESPDVGAREIDPNYVVGIFEAAYREYKDPYKQAVLDDFARLGYPCTDISVRNISELLMNNNQAFGLAVQEKGLDTYTAQISMSQGMFRALAVVIQLQFNIFSKRAATILVDDIGEGLDFERSVSTIKLLIERAEENQIQLLMTTNDRFVMNEVPLEYWSVLYREGHRVHVYNKNNSGKNFEDFKYIGLSNFDFFVNGFFLGGS